MIQFNALLRHATVAVVSGLLLSACADQSPLEARVKEPPQCKMDEQYICVGKSASRLDTDSDTDAEFCQCARLNELPQMGPGGP
ncbi:MAG TPA: hypothetical protein VIS04_09165 [Woeseiaceae bacterium]